MLKIAILRRKRSCFPKLPYSSQVHFLSSKYSQYQPFLHGTKYTSFTKYPIHATTSLPSSSIENTHLLLES